MEAVLDILSWILIVIGGTFGIIGGLGIVRLPTFFTRIHAAGMTETGKVGTFGGINIPTVSIMS